jgi:hypothetical protein
MATNGRRNGHAQNYLKNLSSRYTCAACGSRVYPYERIMGLAELHNDTTGNDVLLYSLNNGIEPGLPKWAYCDHDEKYVQCNRVTNHDLILQRVQRGNITWRLPDGVRATAGNVEKTIAKYMLDAKAKVAAPR